MELLSPTRLARGDDRNMGKWLDFYRGSTLMLNVNPDVVLERAMGSLLTSAPNTWLWDCWDGN